MPRTATRPRNRFRGTERTSRTTRRTPIESDSGGTQIETVTTTRAARNRRVERRTPIATGGTETSVSEESTPTRRVGPNVGVIAPTRAGEKAGSVGLLEAEFLGCLMLLVLVLFADSSKSFADKIMSTMKRGTMLALLFFILALISGVGPNAGKIAKAIGGMVFVGTLLTSPMTDILGNLDTFLKADWVGTGEAGTDTTSTSAKSSAPSGALGDLIKALEAEGVKVPTSAVSGGLAGVQSYIKNLPSEAGQAAKNALEAILKGGIL